MLYRFILILIILIFTFLFKQPLLAEDKANNEVVNKPILSDSLDLDWLIDKSVNSNPEIIHLVNKSEAQKEKILPSGALDDPVFSLGIVNFPMIDMSFRSTAMTQKRISLEQKFPFPGKRKLRREIASYEAESVEKQIQEKKIELIYNLKQAYYELAYVNEAIKITNKNKELILKLIDITQIKYEVGRGLQQDILKAQIEYSKLNEELIFLEQKKDNLKNKIIKLCYFPYDHQLADPEPLKVLEIDVLFDDLANDAFANRPLLQEIEILKKAYEEKYQLAKKEALPDFKVIGAYGQRDNGFADLFSLSIAFNLPVYKKNKQDKVVSELEYQILSLDSKIESIKNEIKYSIKDLLINTNKEKRMIKLLDNTILPQTLQVLDASIANYEVDKTEFISVIDAQLMYYKYEKQYFNSLAQYYINYATLEYLTGTTLF